MNITNKIALLVLLTISSHVNASWTANRHVDEFTDESKYIAMSDDLHIRIINKGDGYPNIFFKVKGYMPKFSSIDVRVDNNANVEVGVYCNSGFTESSCSTYVSSVEEKGLMKQIKSGSYLKFRPKGKNVVRLSLKGSSKAISNVLNKGDWIE